MLGELLETKIMLVWLVTSKKSTVWYINYRNVATADLLQTLF
jgi:hypothetical protein